jgi:chaperonin GroES
MALKPLADRVLLKIEESESKTKGGIILPDTAKEKPQQGKIIAVGKGKIMDDGTVAPMAVKEGDKVLFGKYSGNEVNHKGEDYLLIREEDILAIVK